jgi:hypothetical protein
VKKTRKIYENGIGSNYRTLNNNPFSHFQDSRIVVDIYPTSPQRFVTNVKCDDLGFDSGLVFFRSEEEARLFAINLTKKIQTKLGSK